MSAAAFISGALLVLVVSVSAVSAQDEEESTESFSSAVAAGLATGQILPSDSFGPGFLADGIDTSGDGVETIEENGMAIALVAGNLVFEGEGEATLETEATESGDGSASGFSDVSAFAGGAGGGGEASSNNYIAAGAEEAATTASAVGSGYGAAGASSLAQFSPEGDSGIVSGITDSSENGDASANSYGATGGSFGLVSGVSSTTADATSTTTTSSEFGPEGGLASSASSTSLQGNGVGKFFGSALSEIVIMKSTGGSIGEGAFTDSEAYVSSGEEDAASVGSGVVSSAGVSDLGSYESLTQSASIESETGYASASLGLSAAAGPDGASADASGATVSLGSFEEELKLKEELEAEYDDGGVKSKAKAETEIEIEEDRQYVKTSVDVSMVDASTKSEYDQMKEVEKIQLSEVERMKNVNKIFNSLTTTEDESGSSHSSSRNVAAKKIVHVNEDGRTKTKERTVNEEKSFQDANDLASRLSSVFKTINVNTKVGEDGTKSRTKEKTAQREKSSQSDKWDSRLASVFKTINVDENGEESRTKTRTVRKEKDVPPQSPRWDSKGVSVLKTTSGDKDDGEKSKSRTTTKKKTVNGITKVSERVVDKSSDGGKDVKKEFKFVDENGNVVDRKSFRNAKRNKAGDDDDKTNEKKSKKSKKKGRTKRTRRSQGK